MATNTPIDWKKAVIAKKTAKVTIDERVPLGKPFRSLSTDSGEQKLDRKVIREVNYSFGLPKQSSYSVRLRLNCFHVELRQEPKFRALAIESYSQLSDNRDLVELNGPTVPIVFCETLQSHSSH